MVKLLRIVRKKHLIAGKFQGMNWYAARELRIDFPYSKSTIVICGKMSGEKREWTIKHEVLERRLMKRGMPYREAHLLTTVIMHDYPSMRVARIKESAFLNSVLRDAQHRSMKMERRLKSKKKPIV